MKIMDYVLVIFGAIITILGAVGIFQSAQSSGPAIYRTTNNTANIIGIVMFFVGILIMIIGAIIIEKRGKETP